MNPRSAMVSLAFLAVIGCGPVDAGLFLKVEAPLQIPAEADALQVLLTTARGDILLDKRYGLLGQKFPVSLNLVTSRVSLQNGDPLTVKASALKGDALAKPWSSGSAEGALAKETTTEVTVRLCDCAQATP